MIFWTQTVLYWGMFVFYQMGLVLLFLIGALKSWSFFRRLYPSRSDVRAFDGDILTCPLSGDRMIGVAWVSLLEGVRKKSPGLAISSSGILIWRMNAL